MSSVDSLPSWRPRPPEYLKIKKSWTFNFTYTLCSFLNILPDTSPVPRLTDLRHTTPPSVQIWHIIEVWKIALFVSSVLKHFFREFRISLSHSILSQSCRATVEFVVDIIYTFDAKTCQTKRQMPLRIKQKVQEMLQEQKPKIEVSSGRSDSIRRAR